MVEWKVPQEDSGLTIAAFLKAKLGERFSARKIKKAIESNLCMVNGRVERFASACVGKGDVVSITIDQEVVEVAVDRSRVLYEDEDLLVYNKPAGMISEDKRLEALGLVVHRLDKDTTGALIFAKSEEMRERMFGLFREHKVDKEYLCIVDGVPAKSRGKIENFLGKLRVYQGQTLWGEVAEKKGLYACTLWSVEDRGKNASLIRCQPKTGRTHQIRVHMSEMGHPILGDYQYGRKFLCDYRPKRYLLHAQKVSFTHPKSLKKVEVTAPLPHDFTESIGKVVKLR